MYEGNINNEVGVVMTLDAGGTNLVFSAISAGKEVVEKISLPSFANNLDACLNQIVNGFTAIKEQLSEEPVAISFAFPGPADYKNGIIGGFLPNFPSFRDGVALGDFLKDKFQIPVFINNDADLFAYGEALMGKLPEINDRLLKMGSVKQYHNLLGYTFGTGLGFGFVSNGELHIGDNSCVETFCLPIKTDPDIIVEDGASIRAIKRVYIELSGDNNPGLDPKDIFEIAEGERFGDRASAIKSFETFGEMVGNAIATALTLIDGIIVIGGGLVGGRRYFMPALLQELRGTIGTLNGERLNRVQMEVYDLDDEAEFNAFATSGEKQIKVYGSERSVTYNYEKKVGIATSSMGASNAIALGAYAYAINKIKDEGLHIN